MYTAKALVAKILPKDLNSGIVRWKFLWSVFNRFPIFFAEIKRHLQK